MKWYEKTSLYKKRTGVDAKAKVVRACPCKAKA